MPPDEAVEPHGALEIHLIPGREIPERGPGEGLGPDVEADAVAVELHRRQANTVHGEARADLAARECHTGANHEPGVGAAQYPAGLLDDSREHSASAARMPAARM